jgi:hypothetical protein
VTWIMRVDNSTQALKVLALLILTPTLAWVAANEPCVDFVDSNLTSSLASSSPDDNNLHSEFFGERDCVQGITRTPFPGSAIGEELNALRRDRTARNVAKRPRWRAGIFDPSIWVRMSLVHTSIRRASPSV